MKNNFIIRSKFFYLLSLLILYSLCTSIFSTNTIYSAYLGILFSLLILLCIFIITHDRYLTISIVILGVMSLASHWIIHIIHPDYYVHVFFYTTSILFLILITYIVLSSIMHHQQITTNSLLGAICGYFLIGYVWSNIYLLIATINPEAFSQHIIGPSIHVSVQHAFYFSFTTMTTLGYGDILPISNIARTCSWLEALTGQIYLAVWISQLVGLRIKESSLS